MFYETEPHRWTFHHTTGLRPSDPLMVPDTSGRARPKLSSFDASRPGLFAPRPFHRDTLQRERRSSDGASCSSEEDRHSQASSNGSCADAEREARSQPASQPSSGPRERIIPIRLEGDGEEDEAPKDAPPVRPLRKHQRRDTTDGADVASSPKGRIDEEIRDARAQSCPVTSPLENATGKPSGPKTSTKFAPLKVNEALASQQRDAQAPGGRGSYQNMSPKPFSPGARPFKSSSFGMFGSPSPTRTEAPTFESATLPRPPPVPPKPSAAEIRAANAARHQPPQQRNSAPELLHPVQKQKQEAPEEPKPQPPKSAKDQALSKIASIRSDLDPVTRRLETFRGFKGDKEYLFLDEMLTRGLLKLDGLDTGGDAEVRSARKEAVRHIEDTLSALERASKPRDDISGDVQKSASVVTVNGVKMSAEEADRRATSAPPQGLARAEPAVVSADIPAEDGVKRRVSGEHMGRR